MLARNIKPSKIEVFGDAERTSTIKREQVEVVPGSVTSSELACDSRSYPNLPCQYELHRLDAYVPNLPEGSFTTKASLPPLCPSGSIS